MSFPALCSFSYPCLQLTRYTTRRMTATLCKTSQSNLIISFHHSMHTRILKENRMSNGTKGNFGNNLTTIIVALLGAVSAIGGAWITTYGANSADRTEAAAPSVIAGNNGAQTQPVQPSAGAVEASPLPQPTIPIVVVPEQNSAPRFLPNSAQIAYNKAWPNDSRVNQLVLETVEVADNVVRVHLRFDNPTSGAVKFHTSLGAQGIRSYITHKKAPEYPATGTGGALFADPSVVEIPAGASKQGWIEYTTGGVKLSSIDLHLESYTEGYPAGQSGTISYNPIKLKVGK